MAWLFQKIKRCRKKVFIDKNKKTRYSQNVEILIVEYGKSFPQNLFNCIQIVLTHNIKDVIIILQLIVTVFISKQEIKRINPFCFSKGKYE